MKPPKKIMEKAMANGSIDRASLLLSAAYLLNTEASILVEEAGDILRRNGLLLGEIKQVQNRFTSISDRYFAMFAEMIGEHGQEKAYFDDLESFDLLFREWAKLDENEESRKNNGKPERCNEEYAGKYRKEKLGV